MATLFDWSLLSPSRGAYSRLGLSALTVVFAATSFALVGCGSDDTGGGGTNPGSDPVPEEGIVDIDTVVESSTVTAGEPIDVECQFLGPDDEPVDIDDPPNQRVLEYPDDGFDEDDDGELIATRAGDAKLACQSAELGLTDDQPAHLEVEPGPAHTTVAELSDHQITAGDTVEATCDVYDEFGNRVDDVDTELVSDTSSSSIVVDNTQMTIDITTTGLFTFSCLADNADERFGDPVEVLPDKPAELSADAVPDQEIYGIGQVVTIGTYVVDRYGNEISSPKLQFEALPQGETFGDGRFRFHSDGIYIVEVQVVEPTHNDEPLFDEVEIVVNATGPEINCLYPADGEMIDHTPGEPITFEASSNDEHGTHSVYVDGQEVTLEEGGIKGALEFETSVDTEYGINFVDIVAEDEFGEPNVRTCSFLVSDEWAGEDEFLDDAVSLSLFQPAIDDGEFEDGQIDSLNDIIMTALNSDGLEDMIDEELADEGPFDVGTCGGELYIEDVYLHQGPDHVTSLELVDDGLNLAATFNQISIDLRIETDTWSLCVGSTFSPTAHLDYLDIDLTSDLELSGGQPSFTLRQVNHVTSGEVDLEGSNSFSDLLYGAIDSLFQSTLRDLVEDTFEDVITDNFDEIFSDLVESLDVESLGTSFDVPRLDSDNDMSLLFDFQFSTIAVDGSDGEAQFGLAPRIVTGWPDIPDGNSPGANSLGVAHPPGPMLADHSVPSTFNPEHSAAAGAHVALLNQALHSLWRGGLFHADVGGSLGDGLPDDVSVELSVGLPPVVALGDDEDEGAELMLGAADIDLVYPGIFDDPVTLTAGAVASTGVELDDAELSFSDVTIDEFYLSPQGISLNPDTRDILEDFIEDLLQDIIDQSLNAALPSLPIPSFEIPSDMTEFDLPEDEEIGIYDTSMKQDERHLELYGSFGVE